MSAGARVAAAALAEVGVALSPSDIERSAGRVPSDVPIDVRYRAVSLARMAMGHPPEPPVTFVNKLNDLHTRTMRPSGPEWASMHRFYDIHVFPEPQGGQ
jgi:hypothetical protein